MSNGFKNVDETRFGQYRRCIENMADAVDDGTAEALLSDPQSIEDLTDSMSEAFELRTIYQELGPRLDSELRSRLKLFIKGPAAYRDERTGSSGNRPRNIGFELSMGALLLKFGFAIEFHPDGDLRFKHQGHEFFIECKRPQSKKQINSRVRDARDQLSNRYDEAADPAAARGLIALSATKIANPAGKNLRTASLDSLGNGLAVYAEEFIDENRSKWRNPRDLRTLGCIVELRAFVFVESANPTTCVHLGMNNRNGLSRDDDRLFATIANQIQQIRSS